jgi:protein-disulfide isomerase
VVNAFAKPVCQPVIPFPALAGLDSAAVQIPTLGSPSRGPANARVTLVEFSDFQCPSCRQAYTFLDSLARAFPRDLRIVFKHYPLQFHPYAFAAAEAATAAMDQGKFWEYAGVVYAHQDEIDQDALIGWACTVGLDVRAFSKSLYAGKHRARVRIDMREADRVGVRGTPMLYLNGHGYWGRRTLHDMVPVVNALLAQPGTERAGGR